jgi:WD40 repeat protein
MEKDRTRRYETANELAMDIERHLGDEPVSAGPPSVRYRLHKFVRRHRTGVAAGLLVAAAIVAGLAVSTTMYFQAEQAREKENAARVMAEQAREIETIARKQAEQAKEGEIKQRQLTEKEKEKTRKLLYSTQIALVGSELKNENTANAKRLLQECPEDLRNWEYDYLKYISDQSQMTLRGHAGGVQRVVFTPDGKRLISGGRDGTIRKWNIATGTELMKIDAHEYYITSIKINPNGKQIASSSPERTVKLWDLDNGNLIHTLNGHTGYVYCVDFSPDGKRLASCSSDSTVRVWDVNAAEEILLLTIPNRKIASVAFSPDGKKLVAVTITGSDGNRFIKVWDSVTGKLLKEKSESDFGSLGVSHFWDLEFDKEGKNILTANWGRALVWDAETLEIKKFISQTHRFGSRRAVFSPDGKQIVTGGVFGPLKIWSSSNGELIRTLHGHVGDIWSIAYSPDGTLIVSGSEDGTIKVWDAAVDYEKIILDGAGNPVQTVCFNSDGTLLASGTTDNLIRIWSTEEWKVLHILFGHSDSITSTNFSPDSRYVVSGSSDNTIKIWRADTGELLKTLKGHLGSVTSVQYSVNGEHIVSSSEDNTIRIWDSETGECKMMLTEHKGGVTSVRYTTDGKYLISGSDDKTVRIWNSKTGECLLTLTGHKKGINRIAVSPNDRWIVSSDPDIAIIWDKETGKQMSSFQEPSDNITDVIFSIDSKRIFSSSEDDIIRIWETETGRCILTLVEFQTGGIQALSVSPNGKTIAAGANWFGNMVILSSQYSKKYVERKTSEAHMEYETYLGLLELEKDPQKIPRQAKLFAGHHYFFCPKLMAWKEAKEYAEFVGGHLATITSKEENDWIIQTFSHLFNYWLGGTDEDEEGRWKWITGEEWKYSSWAKGEPGNQNGNEHSLKMYSNGLWNDNLSEIHFYFLIEWEY